jgi:hypothetical protein
MGFSFVSTVRRNLLFRLRIVQDYRLGEMESSSQSRRPIVLARLIAESELFCTILRKGMNDAPGAQTTVYSLTR